MIISICGSMVFTDKMIEFQKILEAKGHKAMVSGFAEDYKGKEEKQIEKLSLSHKLHNDAMREFFEKIKKSDAILILNYDRKGVRNYIGGNTLMEIGLAHALNKKIYLLNPVPEIEYYKAEIEATKPVILNGDMNGID